MYTSRAVHLLIVYNVVRVLYSGLFSNQKFLRKCLNINFGGFIFEAGIFRSIAIQLFVSNDIT